MWLGVKTKAGMRSEQSDRKTSGERQPETGGVSTVFLRRVFSLSLSHNRWISERLGLEYLFTCLHTRCSRLQTFPDWSWDQMCKNSHFYSKIFFWCTIKILFYSFASVWEGSPATSWETLIFLSHLSASLSKDLKEHKTKLKFTLRNKSKCYI